LAGKTFAELETVVGTAGAGRKPAVLVPSGVDCVVVAFVPFLFFTCFPSEI
jgi:hypothetical protein